MCSYFRGSRRINSNILYSNIHYRQLLAHELVHYYIDSQLFQALTNFCF
jgi:hypothetical protein